MIPIVLDPSKVSFAVIGEGPETCKRLALIDAGGARHVAVYAPEPSQPLLEAAGPRLRRRWPAAADFEGLGAVFIGDLPPERAEAFFVLARAKGALCNVEDVPPLCDFHVPSLVRRGDLLIAVSTGGKSPALAQIIRSQIEHAYGPDWAERLDTIADHRRLWRREGLSPSEIRARTIALVEASGWHPSPPSPTHKDGPA